MEKIKFRELLADQVNGSSEDIEFCIGFAEKHQMKGDISDTELLKQILGILAMGSNREHSRKIMAQNEAVSNGIRTLEKMNCWPQLHRISEHALEAAIGCIEKEPDKPFVSMLAGDKIRLAVMKMGSDEFPQVFNKEFLEKMGLTKE